MDRSDPEPLSSPAIFVHHLNVQKTTYGRTIAFFVGSGRRAAAGAAVLALAASACFFNQPRVFTDDLVPVPDMSGMEVREARQELEALGFIVQVVPEGATPPPPVLETDPPVFCPDGVVVAQDPPPDEDVLQASTVVLAARDC